MANEYRVVGEYKTDEQHLLVVGDDGQFYDYSLDGESMDPVEPDDRWQVDEPGAGDDPGMNMSAGADFT